MSEKRGFKPVPGFQETQATAEHFLMNGTCREINGTHSCPATNMVVVSDGPIAMIPLQAARGCIYVGMTPDGVRHFAAQLVDVANTIEAQFNSEVNQHLAATLAKRADQ